MLPDAITRKEMYYQYLSGDKTITIPDPVTREEQYLYYVCKNGTGSGGTIPPEQIAAAVEQYLEENPVQPTPIDETLTRSGEAADAAAVGKRLEALEKGGTTSLEKTIENYYAMRRTGKVYRTMFWKFATNPTSAGEKQLDNEGLEFAPSTDTTEGTDDYANIPLFEWKNVNYVREEDGSPVPTALEDSTDYKTSGSVDVGVMQMSFYWRWESLEDRDIITISDTPHPELGLEPWVECVKEDGTVLPWCIGSKYISGYASDGLLRSQPDLKAARKQSHNEIVARYKEKGVGYTGAGACRNLFQIIFNAIKGATKNSKSLYKGCTNYNYQYNATEETEEKRDYIVIAKANAENLVVGSYASIGYASNNNGRLEKDRGRTTVHEYADDVKILKIEDIDENNSAVYLDVVEKFDTMPVALTDTLSAPIMITTMHWRSGSTDTVKGLHDGSPVSNTNWKCPYRVQGREYAIGSYIVASDTVMDFQSDYSKKVYVAKKGTTHTTSDAAIRSTYKDIATIPDNGSGADWWVGDISVDMETGGWNPSGIGSSDSQGYGDRIYSGGKGTGTREYLMGGNLSMNSNAGPVSMNCGLQLGSGDWHSCACD